MSLHGTDHGDMLAVVNMARVACGQPQLRELPNATKGAPADCLYYRALQGCGVQSVGVETVTFDSARKAAMIAEMWGVTADGTTVRSPKAMTRVIVAFDNHDLPAYDL